MRNELPELWSALPLAGCAGAATAMLPGVLMLLAAGYFEMSRPAPGAGGTGMASLVWGGIVLAVAGGVVGALLGVALGAMGRKIGRRIRGKRSEVIVAVAGGFLGGVIFIAAVALLVLLAPVLPVGAVRGVPSAIALPPR